MSEITQKQLERIKKMMALANDAGATEGEREAALHHATKLLQKYNLELSDLPADQNNEAREEQSVVISADTWARNLCHSVGSLFFCNYFFGRSGTAGRDKHYFVGRQSNVVTAMHMCEYLIKNIKKEATRRYKSPTSPEGRSFCVGTVRTIAARVAEMKRNGAEATPGTALVLANVYKLEHDANEQWIKDQGMTIREGKARQDNALRAGAYHAGREHGKSVSLNQQVTAGSAVKRTLLK